MKLIDCSELYAVKQYLLMLKINHVSYYTNESFYKIKICEVNRQYIMFHEDIFLIYRC